MKGLSRVYLSVEAKREARKKAADNDCSMVDYFDEVLLGKKKNKKRGGMNYFDF